MAEIQGRDALGRRTWNKELYEKKYEEGLNEDEEKKKKGLLRRDYLKHRTEDLVRRA